MTSGGTKAKEKTHASSCSWQKKLGMAERGWQKFFCYSFLYHAMSCNITQQLMKTN